MSTYPVQFEITNVYGYLSIASYIHYFTPGSLKIRSKIYVFGDEELKAYVEEGKILETRRWFQKGEAPYPGYCRAPGSAVCLPLLCNCVKLKEIWDKLQYIEEKLKGFKKVPNTSNNECIKLWYHFSLPIKIKHIFK